MSLPSYRPGGPEALQAPDLFAHARPPAVPAPFLPTTRAEMNALGWDECDVVLVTGDAYVDAPSFGMAIVGRLLESQGYRVGILAQPDWRNPMAFRELGRPRLFFGITAGNMDSMVNHYTSDRKIRRDDAYTPDGRAGARPDRAVIVYAQRCREVAPGVPVIIGGIESSLRRIAHYDYWSDKVRRSVLVDAKADLLVYGNGDRAIVDVARRLAAGEAIATIDDVRGTAFVRRDVSVSRVEAGFVEIDSSEVDEPGRVDPHPDPYATEEEMRARGGGANARGGPGAREDGAAIPADGEPGPVALVQLRARSRRAAAKAPRSLQFIRLPSYEAVVEDPVLYAHASRVLHLESNPGNARALVQAHGDREVWLNPPPIPLTTPEMDRVYELPYQRRPHPRYDGHKIPAFEMIRFSVTITRGCFGGCSFCSITEHEGRIIQNRSEDSIVREVEAIRDRVPGFTGIVSDLGGPTANMWRLACKDANIQNACRKPSCVFPGICENLNTDQMPLVHLYRRVRAIPGVKRVFIASGLRYDLAVETPAYVEELVKHHVGGYLKIAPEHTEDAPLRHMMKPGVGTYDRFKAMFERYSKQAGKKQFLIPYFIAAHPGTRDEDMLSLALWLKRNGFRPDQVQAFLPSPMASATAMYHTGLNPLRPIRRQGGEVVFSAKQAKQRRLHKAFLRYHDPENWPLLRDALRRMGREDLIGNGPDHLVPHWQPAPGSPRAAQAPARGPRPGVALTQHTGLPPRVTGGRKPADKPSGGHGAKDTRRPGPGPSRRRGR